MPANRKTVLILEDEAMIAMALEDFVRDIGFSPVVSVSIDDALSVINSGLVDLAIVDYMIRNKTSEPVALALRSRAIPFLVCSGLLVEKLAGAFDGATLVGKPYDEAELQAAVIAALG